MRYLQICQTDPNPTRNRLTTRATRVNVWPDEDCSRHRYREWRDFLSEYWADLKNSFCNRCVLACRLRFVLLEIYSISIDQDIDVFVNSFKNLHIIHYHGKIKNREKSKKLWDGVAVQHYPVKSAGIILSSLLSNLNLISSAIDQGAFLLL